MGLSDLPIPTYQAQYIDILEARGPLSSYGRGKTIQADHTLE